EAAAPCFARMNAARNAALSRDPSFPGPRPAPAQDGSPTAAVEELIRNARTLVGSPEDCIRNLEVLSDQLGLTHVIGTFHFGGMPRDVVRRGMELFIREVAPPLRQRGQAPRASASTAAEVPSPAAR